MSGPHSESEYADMAELADAHGSGPCEGSFMKVRILLSAPKVLNFQRKRHLTQGAFFHTESYHTRGKPCGSKSDYLEFFLIEMAP